MVLYTLQNTWSFRALEMLKEFGLQKFGNHCGLSEFK